MQDSDDRLMSFISQFTNRVKPLSNVAFQKHRGEITMIDREIVKEFLEEKIEDTSYKIPHGVSQRDLVEAFCQFVEIDFHDWLRSNFRYFEWNDEAKVRERVKEVRQARRAEQKRKQSRKKRKNQI